MRECDKRLSAERDLKFLIGEYNSEIIREMLSTIAVCDFSICSEVDIVDYIMKYDDDAIDWLELTARIIRLNNGSRLTKERECGA